MTKDYTEFDQSDNEVSDDSFTTWIFVYRPWVVVKSENLARLCRPWVCFLYELKSIKEVVVASMHGYELDSNLITFNLVALVTVIIGIYNQYIRYNDIIPSSKNVVHHGRGLSMLVIVTSGFPQTGVF